MNIIECSHCQTKYTIKLNSIPRESKFLNCSTCQKQISLPFYSNKDKEFQILIPTTCGNCQKRYSIPSSKFIAPKMVVICFSCKNKYEIHFPNYNHLQKLNQKTATYINEPTLEKKSTTLNEVEQQKFKKLIKEVTSNDTSKNKLILPITELPIPSNEENYLKNTTSKHNLDFKEEQNLAPKNEVYTQQQEQNLAPKNEVYTQQQEQNLAPKNEVYTQQQEQNLAPKNEVYTQQQEQNLAPKNNTNYQEWKQKIIEKQGLVPESLKSEIFLSNKKFTELERSDIPSLPELEEKKENITKKNNISSLFISLIIFSLIILIIAFYLYLIK